MTTDTQQFLQRSLLGEAIDQLDGLAVFVWNEERRYVAVNRAACELLGMARDDVIGMHVGDLTPDGAVEAMALVTAGTVTDGSSSFTRPDGEAVALEWTTVHTRIAGLPYLVSVVRRSSR